MKALRWNDARKSSPKENQFVAVSRKMPNKDNEFSVYLCIYRENKYWVDAESTCYYKDNTVANHVKFEFCVENPLYWIDANSIFQQIKNPE